MSVGRWIGLVALASRRLARVDLVGLEQRVADRVALGGEEREAHRPADGERVDVSSSASMTPSLSLTLAPPSTATNGRLGSLRIRSSTSTSRCSRRPIADGTNRGGPTIEAWARWDAPKASLT